MLCGVRVSFAIAITATLVACAAAPDRSRVLSTSVATAAEHYGDEVRWGGIVAGKRSTDAGECIEIATMEINQSTGVPPASAEPSYLWSSTFLDRRGKSAPRFLACGVDGAMPAKSSRFGALLTATGTVRPSLNFSVDRASCLQPAPGGLILPSRPDYSGTPHRLTENACDLAMPVLQVRSATSWRDPATSRFIGPRDYREDSSMRQLLP